MAGTTVLDDGLVEEAATRAFAAAGVADDAHDRALRYVRDTMGQSKITVFRALFGSEEVAQRANAAFEEAYADLVAAGRCAPVPGAQEAVRSLREAGVAVAFTTGFAPVTRDAILSSLGWRDLADLALSPVDAGRGRPYPDMVLTAVLRLGVADVRAVAVTGDTASDMRCARSAGAGLAVGVLTGAHDRAALTEAGATHVIDSVRDLPALIASTGTDPASQE
ncbi:phosphonatase-like hydrolase [Marinactinospora thermotolerans]